MQCFKLHGWTRVLILHMLSHVQPIRLVVSCVYFKLAEEIMIETIRSFPCLWQTSSKSYKDLRAKENDWKEVANHVSSINDQYKGIHVYDHKVTYQLKTIKEDGNRSGISMLEN